MDVTHTPRNAARRAQEGSVILVVLLVVMMTGGLAMFAAQSATFESRSIGATRQMQRMRRAGEGFLVAVETLLAEKSGSYEQLLEDADPRWTSSDMQASRDAYGLPTYADTAQLYQVRRESLNAENYPLREKTALPSDSDLMPGVVTPFEFQGVALVEKHLLPPAPGQGIGENNGMAAGAQAYRACVTAYTTMQLKAGDKKRDGDLRAMHESVGVARAYFELR